MVRFFVVAISKPASAYSIIKIEEDSTLLPDTDPAETEIQGWEKEEDLGILQYQDRLEEVTKTYISR